MSQEERWCPPTGYDCFHPAVACPIVALPCTSCEHCKSIDAEGLEQLYGPFGEISEDEAAGKNPEFVFSMVIAESDEGLIHSGYMGYNPGALGELLYYFQSSRPMPASLEIPNLEEHSCRSTQPRPTSSSGAR